MASFYENLSGYTANNTDVVYFTDIVVSNTVTIDGVVVDLLGLTDASARVTPQTVSGVLTAGSSINQLKDSGSFTMPSAGSVDANSVLIVELPEKFAYSTPTVSTTGSDIFRASTGTDTVIIFNSPARLTFTSNGVAEWSL